ncbi:unnamed protein product [Oikopleura dioica]|uniref:Iron-sulfur cluster assembly 1 homolog, mitochondrial n=1 Tax=Oikopleura dioica TaxID=34765 RepID=E4X437_OIKDI|nr:unnamed protein product [Oikopleura dioica]
MSRAAGAIRVVRSRVRPLAPTRAPLTFTPAAIDRLKTLANDEPNNNPVFRIGLRTKGCNGMAYTLEHAEIESKKKFEETVSEDGVTVIIDMKAQMTLLGTEMDYSSNKLEEGFIFSNPNIKGTCGCGESFNI